MDNIRSVSNKVSLDKNTNMSTTMAGTHSSGSAPNELFRPFGIFLHINFDLNVANSRNNRIQLFPTGELNGYTVAGKGYPNNLILNLPTDVVLDADGYLFIADNEHHRLIQAGHEDYLSIAGCTGHRGSASNEFYKPYALRFDGYGNVYVADECNNRIQKFTLATNSCVECHQKL